MKIDLLKKSDYADIMILSFLKEKGFEVIETKLYNVLSKMKNFGIRENRKLLGFMGVSKHEIEALFVSPKYFGKGVGRSLMLYAIKDLNLKKVSVNEQNQKAFDFYKKFGFKSISKTNAIALIFHIQLI
jgi:putative acetyltransferase